MALQKTKAALNPVEYPITPNKLNPLYFFNNHYNDEILLQCLRDFKTYQYDYALRTQETTQQSNFISGTIDQFTIDSYINSAYKLPVNTYTYEIERLDIPFYNLKLFLNTYGYGVPISLIQIMEDHKVFKHRLVCSLGPYVFLKLRIIYTEFDKAILCIYPSTDEGVSNTKIKSMITSNDPTYNTWSLYSKPHSDYYYNTATTINTLFGTSNSFIQLNKFNKSHAYHKISVTDKWDMLITGDATNPNLLYQTYATYGSDTSGNTGFTIATQVKDYIKVNLNPVKCFIINDYRRVNSYQFSVIDTADPSIILNTYGNKNPISPNNIIAYQFDSTHIIKMNRIGNSSDAMIEYKYPDVYKITLPNPGIYVIDTYESDLTMSVFDNNFDLFKRFMNTKYPNIYTSAIYNKDLPSIFKSYTPKTVTYDYDNYKASDQYGDVRAYNIYKLFELRDLNPARYIQYAKSVNDLNRKVANYYNDLSSSDSIYNRVVQDTSNNTASPADIVTFTEDHLYLEFTNSDNIDHPVLIFVDGRRVIPTVSQTFNNKTCAYIPKSKVTATSIITAKMELVDSRYSTAKQTGSFTPANVNEKYQFPNAEGFGKINNEDLLYYNSQTREYIDPNKINLSMGVSQYLIDHPVSSDPNVYFGITPDNYLITNDDKYFKTNAGEYVTLTDDIQYIDIDSTDTTHSIQLNKDIDAKTTSLSINTPSLINADISVTNTNTFVEVYNPNAVIGSTNTLTFKSFGGKPDVRRFMVYANGVLLTKDVDYTLDLTDLKYGDDLNIIINPMAGASGKLELIADYMPERQYLAYNKSIQFASFSQGLIVLSRYNQWPVDYRYALIYKNGLLVNKNEIFEYPINNIIKINNIKENDIIQIYYTLDQDFSYYYCLNDNTEAWPSYSNCINSADVNYDFINNGGSYTGTSYTINQGEFANFLFNLYGTQHEYSSYANK